MDDTWNKRGTPIQVKYFVRPLSGYLGPFIESNFRIVSIDEPLPVPKMKEVDDDFGYFAGNPQFLFFVVEKVAS